MEAVGNLLKRYNTRVFFCFFISVISFKAFEHNLCNFLNLVLIERLQQIWFETYLFIVLLLRLLLISFQKVLNRTDTMWDEVLPSDLAIRVFVSQRE